MFTVQYVDRAFGIGETIPERLWQDQSRHRTLEGAQAARDRDRAEMRKLWGPNAWGGHWRIISDREVVMTSTFLCDGPVSGPRPRSCEDAAPVEWIWEAGKPAPFIDGPAHWHGSACPACHAAEAAIIRSEEAEYVR